MSLPVPLAVRLQTSKADRHITRDLRDLTYRSTIPGGFASARLSLHRPLSLQPDEIDYYADVTVYDRLTGEVEWEGWLEDPARQVSSDGQVWDLSAIGSAGHARDRTVPLIYVDRSLERWMPERPSSEHPQADRRADRDIPGNPVLRMAGPRDTVWASGATCTMAYRVLRDSGLQLGAFNCSGDAGKTTVDVWRWETVTRLPNGTGTVVRTVDFTTAGIAASQAEVVDHFPDTSDWLELRFRNVAAAAQTADDDVWAEFGSVRVQMKLFDRAGTPLGAAYDYRDGSVLASEVVADLLGRLLTRYDGANAAITATTYGIEQLAYPDGITPAKVLDDLMLFEPDHYWAAWERDPTSGKYRFEWTPWSSDVRYDASIRDGFDSPASAAGLYNRVTVRYRDSSGAILNQVVQATVTALDNAGVIRQALIDLGDEVGSASAATRAGEQFLLQHKTPPNAGRLTISRPIYDAVRGRMVPPWKIRPGGLVRVRGVEPHIDSLNPPARDGATVFRVIGHEFHTSTASATLELDSTPLSVAASLADLRATAGRRRR